MKSKARNRAPPTGTSGSGVLRGYAEDLVDLVGREVLVGFTGRDDQVGRQLDLAQQVGVLERHVELVVHAGPLPARGWYPPGYLCRATARARVSVTRVVGVVTADSDPIGWWPDHP